MPEKEEKTRVQSEFEDRFEAAGILMDSARWVGKAAMQNICFAFFRYGVELGKTLGKKTR